MQKFRFLRDLYISFGLSSGLNGLTRRFCVFCSTWTCPMRRELSNESSSESPDFDNFHNSIFNKATCQFLVVSFVHWNHHLNIYSRLMKFSWSWNCEKSCWDQTLRVVKLSTGWFLFEPQSFDHTVWLFELIIMRPSSPDLNILLNQKTIWRDSTGLSPVDSLFNWF